VGLLAGLSTILLMHSATDNFIGNPCSSFMDETYGWTLCVNFMHTVKELIELYKNKLNSRVYYRKS
jgi:hypothetical protein